MESYYSDVCPDCKIDWFGSDHLNCQVFDYSDSLWKDFANMAKVMSSPEWHKESMKRQTHGTHECYQQYCKLQPEGACQECISAMQAYGKSYRARPGVKERKANWNRTRRSRARHSVSTKIMVEELVSVYGAICHICNKDIDLDAPRKTGVDGWEEGLHVDHVIPISKGGKDIIENVRPSHGKCNIRKYNRVLEDIATE